MFASKYAKKVYAVEANSTMAQIAKNFVKENNLSEKVRYLSQQWILTMGRFKYSMDKSKKSNYQKKWISSYQSGWVSISFTKACLILLFLLGTSF